MLYFVSGPIDKDLINGTVDNWHLEAFNNSDCSISVNFKVFSIQGPAPVLIGYTGRVVEPHSHEYISLNINENEHTIAQVEYIENTAEVLLTLTGRDKSGKALPGAIFFNKQLIPLSQGIIA